MGSIRVTSSELRNRAAELRNLNTMFRSCVEEMRDHATNLDSMWEGEAHDAFRNAFFSDVIMFDDFSNGINGYAAVLEQIADNYDQADAKAAAIAGTGGGGAILQSLQSAGVKYAGLPSLYDEFKNHPPFDWGSLMS